MAKLVIMNQGGDEVMEHDSKTDSPSVRAAMDRFNDLVKNHGHWAYRVNQDGSKESTKKFDKDAPEILLHPQLIGG